MKNTADKAVIEQKINQANEADKSEKGGLSVDFEEKLTYMQTVSGGAGARRSEMRS